MNDISKALLELLHKSGGAATATYVAEALAKHFKLSKAYLAQRQAHGNRPNGESLWKLRLRRAKADLIRSGQLSRSADRGQWRL